MSYISGRLGRLLAGASTIVALSATLTLAPSATGAQPDGPHYGQPVVGQCRNYTFNAMNRETNSTPVTACSNAHTAVVLAVPQLPATLNYSSNIDAVYQVMENACYPAFAKKLGRTPQLRHLSAYTVAWYFPTQTQRDHGARWIRCDLILAAGTTLQRLPKNTTPVLPAAPLPNAVAACRAGTDYVVTVCAKTHQYRATGVIVLSGAYPGNAALERLARQKCPAKVSTSRFHMSWSDRSAWKAGDKAITCWSHRSN